MGTNTTGARSVGEWVLTQNIGAGSFAVVWKARHTTTGQIVAIKEISTDKLNKKLRQSLETEVSILKQITHRNIVQLLEVIEETGRIFLVMEYCAGGDMAKFIRRQKRIPEATARALLRQLSAGLRELWSRNLVHRDLKPQNLLLSTNEAGEKLLKIADFGFARSLQPQGLAETLCGSPLYMAPEILQFHKYDAKADLWSVGTILYELVVGKPPFNGANHVALLRAIERQEAQVPEPIRRALSSACVSLLHGLLRRNPVERLTFEEFFSHPFLRSGSRSSSSQSGSRNSSSSQSSSLTISAEPSPMKPADRETSAQPISGARPGSMPAASPEDNLPFLLDEDPSRGSSKHGSQAGSSVHGATAMQLLQQQQPQPQQEQQSLQHPRRAWSIDPQPGLQAQQPYGSSPAQLPGRAPPVSERSQSLGTQHAIKQAASNPFLISSERQHGSSQPVRNSHSGRSGGPPAFMPATPQQPLPAGMGNLVDEEEDYVIIEGASPSTSAHGTMPRRGSLPATQPMPSSLASAGTPPLYRGSPYSRSLPENSQSHFHGGSPQATLGMSTASVTSPVSAMGVGASTFASGMSRLELLMRTARILEGLAASKHAGGAPQDALALRLITIQVLKEAVRLASEDDSRAHSAVPDKALTAQRIMAETRALAGRCEESAAAAAEGMDEGEELPECWQLIYKAALALAKAAAVDELLGNAASSMRAYHKAGSLLHFMFEEAPRMDLSPDVRLSASERQRLKRYAEDIFVRYCAVSTGSAAATQHARPLHLSVHRPQAVPARS